MEYAVPNALQSTEWLEEHLSAPDVRVVDATWHIAPEQGNAREQYEQCHIPGAVFFDIDEICDTESGLPHMLPSMEKFSSKVRKLGLGDGNRIVVYDAHGGYMAACRVWWMFRVFGHEDVAILNGGLPKWLAEGRRVDDMPPHPRERRFTARFNNVLYRDLRHMQRNQESRKEQVVDARGPDRFAGNAPEPRPGLPSGHMPGSVNLPYSAVLDEDNHWTLRSPADIKAAAEGAGVDLNRPITVTCGSGVTACAVAFSLFMIGHKEVAVYDGSWAEWASQDGAPIATV